jgi:hypothetical protein
VPTVLLVKRANKVSEVKMVRWAPLAQEENKVKLVTQGEMDLLDRLDQGVKMVFVDTPVYKENKGKMEQLEHEENRGKMVLQALVEQEEQLEQRVLKV